MIFNFKDGYRVLISVGRKVVGLCKDGKRPESVTLSAEELIRLINNPRYATHVMLSLKYLTKEPKMPKLWIVNMLSRTRTRADEREEPWIRCKVMVRSKELDLLEGKVSRELHQEMVEKEAIEVVKRMAVGYRRKDYQQLKVTSVVEG